MRVSEDWLANVKWASWRRTFLHNCEPFPSIVTSPLLESFCRISRDKDANDWVTREAVCSLSYFLVVLLFVMFGLLIFLGLHIYIISEKWSVTAGYISLWLGNCVKVRYVYVYVIILRVLYRLLSYISEIKRTKWDILAEALFDMAFDHYLFFNELI